MKVNSNMKGFTLIEVVMVVVILSLLSTMVIPRYLKYRRRAHATTCLANLNQIMSAIEQCRLAGLPVNEINLFGSDALLKRKPVCPSGGTYVLPKDEEAFPACTFADRDPDDVMTWHQFDRTTESHGK